MDKSKKIPCKKTLVRHPEAPPSKTIVIKEPQCKNSANSLLSEQTTTSKERGNKSAKTSEKTVKTSGKTDKTTEKYVETTERASKTTRKTEDPNFNEPQVYSTATISKAIEELQHVKPKKLKSTNELKKEEKLALDEKLTRHMNFPYDKSIYKNLIPLCVKTTTAPVLITRGPLPQKDAEPSLSDFLVEKEKAEYSYEVASKLNIAELNRSYNGLKMTGKVKEWI